MVVVVVVVVVVVPPPPLLTPSLLLQAKALTINLHHYSLLTNESRLHAGLSSFFRNVATNTVDGVEFISLMEGRELPFYASQVRVYLRKSPEQLLMPSVIITPLLLILK